MGAKIYKIIPLLFALCFYQARAQVKTIEELAKDYNGYFTNFINTNIFDQDNLVYKISQKRKDIKIVLNDYSNSSAVIVNRILEGDITDEEFIENYLKYVSLKFITGIRDSMKENKLIDISFMTSAPQNASVVSDICLLYHSIPDSTSKRDAIFFDAIRSAFQQLEANKFNETSRSETRSEYSWGTKPEDRGLTFNNLKSLVEYFDSTKQRILPWFGKYQKDVSIAFENMGRRYRSNNDDLYFLIAEQYFRLQEYKNKYPNSYFIMELTNPNISKSSLKSVDDYQIETLVQLMNKKSMNDMASVWQKSLLKRMDFGSSSNLDRAMYILVKSELLDLEEKSKYYDFIDMQYVSNDDIEANNFYSTYKFPSESMNTNDSREEDPIQTYRFSDRLIMTADVFLDFGSKKNQQVSQDMLSQRTGYKMTLGYMGNHNMTYLSFANGISGLNEGVRYIEFGNGILNPLHDILPGLAIISKSVMRYTSLTDSIPDGSLIQSGLFSSQVNRTISTNGFNIGIGAEVTYMPGNLFYLGVEGLYLTNSIYKTKWKSDGKELTNLDRFNFRGFSVNLRVGFILANL
jgi:hypothetical protein